VNTCLHCGPTHRKLAQRGLCWACSRWPAIRRLYPPLYPKVRASCYRPPQPEPTEEQLEACIAEQRRPENLPAWWDSEERKQGRGIDQNIATDTVPETDKNA
jgi:hypothetical protein